MTLLRWLFDWWFAPEEINGHEACPTYMFRWTLMRLGFGKIYLHHFVGDDWTRDLHDHPKRFISIGIKGCYVEETPAGERFYRAPWIRTFGATHIHRLKLYGNRDCWTIVIVLWPVREWGFWSEGTWIPWKKYITSLNAHKAKNC